MAESHRPNHPDHGKHHSQNKQQDSAAQQSIFIADRAGEMVIVPGILLFHRRLVQGLDTGVILVWAPVQENILPANQPGGVMRRQTREQHDGADEGGKREEKDRPYVEHEYNILLRHACMPLRKMLSVSVQICPRLKQGVVVFQVEMV